jgi:hypothetical protein
VNAYAHEILDRLPIEHIAGGKEFQTHPRQAVLILERDRGPLRLPDHRPFVCILHVVGLPRLGQERVTEQQMIPQAQSPRAARNQPGNLARATSSPFVVRPTRD